MSSTIKRIALVAVAALGLGMITVVPSQAARVTAEATPCWVSTAPYGVLADGETATATASATQVAGAANYIEITCDSDVAASSQAVAKTSGAGSTLALTAGTGGTPATWTTNTAATESVSSDNDIDGDSTGAVIRVYTPTAGTVTTTVAKRVFANGAATDTTLQTFTITVTAAGVADVYSAANSTVYATSDSSATPDSTSDALVVATAPAIAKDAASTVEALKIVVDQEDANDVNLATAVANTVTITGVGRVGVAADTPLGQYAAETAQASDFYIFADGRSGTGTVTVAINGVTFKTYTVHFYGAVATLTATTKITAIAPGATTAGVFEVVAKDANGVVVPSVTITGTASSSTYVTAVTPANDGDADGDQLVGLTTAATAAGAYTVSFKDGQTTPIVSNTVTVTVGKTTAKTVTFSTDKDEYAPGELVTITVKAVDSNGNPVADGSRALLSAVATSSIAIQGTLPEASPTLAGGIKTYTVYAPLIAGDVVVKATEGAATDNVVAGGTAATISTTIKVVDPTGGSSAAIDAANEATDAANAATDAANAAAEAADAATAAAQDAQAAVAALATEVAAMIAGIKAQIIRLTNLVVKIQKKVKA